MVLLSLWRFYSVVFDNLLQESILMRIMWCIYSLVELSYIVWIEVIEFSEIVTFILVKSSLYRNGDENMIGKARKYIITKRGTE